MISIRFPYDFRMISVWFPCFCTSIFLTFVAHPWKVTMFLCQDIGIWHESNRSGCRWEVAKRNVRRWLCSGTIIKLNGGEPICIYIYMYRYLITYLLHLPIRTFMYLDYIYINIYTITFSLCNNICVSISISHPTSQPTLRLLKSCWSTVRTPHTATRRAAPSLAPPRRGVATMTWSWPCWRWMGPLAWSWDIHWGNL